MATQFEIDCAIMAGASYISTRAEINRFPVPSGWTKITTPDSHYQDSDSGFEAVSFRNTSNPNEIVISYAGTYPGQTGDLLADANLATGNNSEQLTQAIDLLPASRCPGEGNQPQSHHQPTGHSLGGVWPPW